MVKEEVLSILPQAKVHVGAAAGELLKGFGHEGSNKTVFLSDTPARLPENDLIVVCNFTSVVRKNYEIGLPRGGKLKQVLNSDFKKFFGSGVSNSKEIMIKEKEVLGKPFSAQITAPPLAVVVFKII